MIEPLLTEKEVAKVLKLSVQKVRLMRAGEQPELPAIKVGSSVRYTEAALRQFIDKLAKANARA